MKQEIKLNYRWAIIRATKHELTSAKPFPKYNHLYQDKSLTSADLTNAIKLKHIKSVQYLSPIGYFWWNIQY